MTATEIEQTTDTSLTVGVRGLRAALTAVLPHVSKDEDAPPDLMRVHLISDPAVDQVALCATDRYTLGCARFRVDDGAGRPLALALESVDAKLILAAFPAPKKTDPDTWLSLEVTGDELSIAESDGLWPGKRLTIPAYKTGPFAGTLLDLLRKTLARSHSGSELIAFDPERVGKFAAAGRAYDWPYMTVQCDGPSGAALVTVGAAFAGLAMPVKLEGGDASLADWATTWGGWLDDAKAVTDTFAVEATA